MPFKDRFFIFCHLKIVFLLFIYYTNKIIKRKKCLECNKTFEFKKSEKSKVILTPVEMIKLIQYLKKKRFKSNNFNLKEELSKLRK